jgi:hypothetical protein
LLYRIEFNFFYIRYYERTICLDLQKIVFSTRNRFIRLKLRISTSKAVKKEDKSDIVLEVKKKINLIFYVILLFFSIISDFYILLGIYLLNLRIDS